MANEDVRLELTKKWLVIAQQDYQAATLALGSQQALLEIALFHSQQCAADGPTPHEALANAHVIAREWMETGKDLVREIPEPKVRLLYA